jgi:hypothetical protein
MAVTTQVLFERPQQEITSLLSQRITQCTSVSLVAGFATVAGLERIAPPLVANPQKLEHLVVGAGTFSAFEAFDGLVGMGVPQDRLLVHLGMSRLRGVGKFERFRPMLHSKIYLMDMGSNGAAVFVGSHNLTAFALGGLNGEAGLLLEGDATDPVFEDLRRHVAASVAGAVQYDPTMKDAYTWWAREYFDGLRIEANDAPTDSESRKTIVILAALVQGKVPKAGDVVYFEAPAALNEARSLGVDIHLYLFDTLPTSAYEALSRLGSARYALACKAVGVEEGRGAEEVNANWWIDDRRNPKLLETPKPFKPRTMPDMHQVRAQIGSTLTGGVEYLFDSGRTSWAAVLDTEKPHMAAEGAAGFLKVPRRRRTEEGEWYPVQALEEADAPLRREVALALKESAPGSGSFILISPRLRRLK